MWSAQSHLAHEGVDSHGSFSLQLLQQHIQSDDSAGPPHSGTERDTQPKVGVQVSKSNSELHVPPPSLASLLQTTGSRRVPAVHHGWRFSTFPLDVPPHQPSELDQDACALRDSVVGPGREVKMSHGALL